MAVQDLHDAFVEELRDMLSGEKQLTKALPKMAKKATNQDLRMGFEEHLEQTEEHIARLERIFESLDMKARAKQCEGIAGIIDEGKQVIEEVEEGDVLDAMLISAAQKVEHYEIASYGTLCAWAESLGLDEAKEILGQTLEEEKATDEKLTQLSSEINTEAQTAGVELE